MTCQMASLLFSSLASPRLAVDVVVVFCLYFVRYCYCCCYYYTIDDATAAAAADVCRSTWCLSICPGLCLYTERVCVYKVNSRDGVE